MDQINDDDDAWITAREKEIEKMWTERVPLPQQAAVEIPEHELPY